MWMMILGIFLGFAFITCCIVFLGELFLLGMLFLWKIAIPLLIGFSIVALFFMPFIAVAFVALAMFIGVSKAVWEAI